MKNYYLIQLLVTCFLNTNLATEYLVCCDVCQSSSVLLDIQLLSACKWLLPLLPDCTKINTQHQAYGTGCVRSVSRSSYTNLMVWDFLL